MLKLIFISLSLCFIHSSFASTLPGWFEKRSKEVAIDQFIEVMNGYPELYKIKKVTTKVGRIDSGEEAVFVEIKFDDSKSCEGRVYSTQCVSAGSGDDIVLMCYMSLTDCLGDKIFNIGKQYFSR